MRARLLFLVILALSVAASTRAVAKSVTADDYPLKVNVLAFGNQIQTQYRGTNCGSVTHSDIEALDSGSVITGSVSARTYTSCDPNWVTSHNLLAEAEIDNQLYLLECIQLNKTSSWMSHVGRGANAIAAASGTPEQQSQAQQNSRRTQPTPLASNCTLIPGLYSGRWSNGRLEILVTKSNGKATGVNYSIRSVGAMQRPTHLTAAQPSSSTSSAPSNAITELQVSSTPDGADIGIDGDFVGNTPSTVSVAAGEHTITIRLSGYQTWERKIKTSGGAVKVSGTLLHDTVRPN